jgi:hypothetical protein
LTDFMLRLSMPLISVHDLPAAIKLRSRFSSSGVQRTLGITQSTFCFQPQLYSLPIKSAATLGNLSQWKPQYACPATYRQSGPI